MLVLGGALLAASPWLQAGPREDLKELRDRIESLQRQLSESEETRAEAAEALNQSERAIGQTLRKLDELVSRRRQASAAVSKLQGQAGAVQEAIASEQAALGKLLYRQYVGGQSDVLKLVLNRQDPNEIARQFRYLRYVSQARTELLAGLRSHLAQLEALSEETRRKGNELRTLQAEETRQMRRLESEKSQHESVYAQVSSTIAQDRKQLSTLKQDEKRLTQLIQRLAAKSARKKSGRKPANEAPPDFDPDAGSGPFRTLKGRLSLPLVGELVNRFGAPREDSGMSWKGLFIAAKSGQEVKAVAGGKVVYSDWLRGFGHLLILDHGDGYMSLYGNNAKLLKRTGEDTRAGDTIAAAGNSGGNLDSGLYFELRYQGRPFDPLAWTSQK
ncbi:MAG: peptidoglycan DD-metalloendopeptidase family protein [Burkholderiales bacterium]